MYTVYKVTNIKNGKYYVGVHKTNNPYDSYMGSGTAIRNAIKKHGIENFRKEIIGIFEDKESAYNLEYSLTENFNEEFTYNMKRGGVGGWSESARLSAKKNVNVESASRNGKIMKELGLGIFSPEVEAKRKVNASKGGIANSGKQKSDEHKSKISKSLKGKQKKYPKNRKSRPMTEETREKLRQKALERNARESER